MSTTACTATICRQQNNASITRVNVRSGPGTSHAIMTTLPVGTGGLRVLESRPDDRSTAAANGKVYVWFRVTLPDDTAGWVRDDLVDIVGECSDVGYGTVNAPTFAFTLTRADPATLAPRRLSTQEMAVARPNDSEERVRRAAFNITTVFEGGGYASYQTLDAGVVSYGRFQFTLAAGSLFSVVDRYLTTSQSETAAALRTQYAERIRNRDATLRNDAALRTLLVRAAEEPGMQAAQDAIAVESYWNRARDVSMTPRNVQTALGRAMIFDMSINHGLWHDMLGRAETALGARPRSRLGENGVREEALIAKVAEIRKERMYKFADNHNPPLPGLKGRVDFWVNLIERGDWNLVGDASGQVMVKTGRSVQVRNP